MASDLHLKATSEAGRFARWWAQHAVYEGFAALAVAIVQLFTVRGVHDGGFAFFLAPPLVAFVVLKIAANRIVQQLVLWFLVAIACGAAIAPFPVVFPRLSGVARGLPPDADRLLTWYVIVWIVFGLGIWPAAFFIHNLKCHTRRAPVTVSRFTCHLGLATLTLLWVPMPMLLGGLLGLWPLI